MTSAAYLLFYKRRSVAKIDLAPLADHATQVRELRSEQSALQESNQDEDSGELPRNAPDPGLPEYGADAYPKIDFVASSNTIGSANFPFEYSNSEGKVSDPNTPVISDEDASSTENNP